MTHDAPDPLVLDLVEWVGDEPRPYTEVIEAWRTSCPRLTVWEDAIERGLVERQRFETGGWMVIVTDRGRQLVREQRADRFPAAPTTRRPVA